MFFSTLLVPIQPLSIILPAYDLAVIGISNLRAPAVHSAGAFSMVI